ADSPRTTDTTNTAAAPSAKTLYTCGMHPWIIQDHPGNCPICGMKLEPVHQTANAAGPAAVSSAITVDPATIQLMNIQTTEITRGPLRRTIRTVGTIDYNETALADVTTKFKGWIEKLDVDATGELVHRGEPLFEIYSPELYSAEAEYLAVVDSTNDSSALALRDAALDKLKFFDISDAQIAELAKAREPRKTLEILAPEDGFVIEKDVVQGQMVDAGVKLYRLADLGIVWVYAQVYEQDLPYVQLGQEATVKLSSLPDREFRGRVTYVYPNVDEKTRTARVRLEFENPGYFLKPGMFVSAQITAELEPSALLVPDSAVLRSGEKNTVFVALPGGKFDARTVVLGPEAEHSMYEVVSGLRAGERVVTSGQFMLDSESQLREAIQKMNGNSGWGETTGEPITTTNLQTADGSRGRSPHQTEAIEGVVYVCPMPEHVSIVYDHPGKCPICGMTLVPVTPSELKQLQPGGKVLYYTCPMPEHASVHSDKPGKCPICGMTLIPVMASPDTIQEATNPSIPNPVQNPALATTNAPAAKQLYTCPMHPDVISDKPGKCPKCGMDLMPVNDEAK
ncbi:MAG TPA: efflux RND transporter periplasmic adaptor subunit, partial [Verrucomicrobiae bacterium]|nr:efflux RND transporter periplasmic adaptor subunit [Verrucomicrobiae bacterium]